MVPFAETKEALGGYYLVEAKDLDEAIALAARIPSVRWGTIEVRPIVPHDMPSFTLRGTNMKRILITDMLCLASTAWRKSFNRLCGSD